MKRRSVGLTSLPLIAALSLLTACQSEPTKIYGTIDTHEKQVRPKATLLSKGTILIDARPPFEVSIATPNGSTEIQWREFNQAEPPFEGRLQTDLFANARRLARKGIGPDSKVLIVGRGKTGEFEEGRLAWTLKFMGVKNVNFTTLESLNWPMTRDEAPPRVEAPLWKPVFDESLQIPRENAIALLKKKKPGVWIIDVRSAAEYLKDGEPFARLGLHPEIVNVPWTEMMDDKDQALPQIRERLISLGIQPNDQIFLLDEWCAKSAGATLLLRDLGYSKAALWAGGLREIRWFAKAGK